MKPILTSALLALLLLPLAPSYSAGHPQGDAIQEALQTKNPEILHAVLGAGHDPNDSVSEGGISALSSALIMSNSATFDSRMIRLLLEYGADPNKKSIDGSTPICSFIGGWSTDSLLALLQYGADPNVVCERVGIHALAVVAFWGSSEDVQLMLDYGAVDKKNKDGCSAMVMALKRQKVASVRLLHKNGSPLLNDGDCNIHR